MNVLAQSCNGSKEKVILPGRHSTLPHEEQRNSEYRETLAVNFKAAFGVKSVATKNELNSSISLKGVTMEMRKIAFS